LRPCMRSQSRMMLRPGTCLTPSYDP
jgi:hypothetical protein